MANPITDDIAVWTAAQTPKSNGGRGNGNGSANRNAYGIKKLRELILELAVRGKLVPQDPTDEPAGVLLAKIAKENARLVKERKIRKQEKLPDVGEDEKPFELPAGWEWTRLSSISFINPRNEAKDDSPASFIPMTLITTSHTGEHGQEESAWGNIKKGYTHFANGDIGLAKITPCFENSKAVVFSNLINGIGAGTTELHIARPIGMMVCNRYVLIYLKAPHFLQLGETKMTGTAGQKRVPKEFFSENPFPLPPLAEQHRIVAKVDELMALCDRLEERQNDSNAAHQALVETLLATLTAASNQGELVDAWQRIADHFATLFTTDHSIDQLKQTILQLAVMGKLVPQDPKDEPAKVLLERIAEQKEKLVRTGEIRKQKPLPVVNDEKKFFDCPDGWVWCKLQDIVYLLGDGLHGTPEYTPGERFYFVNGNNLSDGEIVVKPDTKTVAKDQHEKYKKPLGENSVLVSINGTLGNVAFYNNEEIILGKSACFFNLAEDIYKRFIKVVIEAPNFKTYAYANATGTTIKNLGLGAMNSLPISLPPKEEQLRIVTQVDQLMALCDGLEARLKEAQVTQVQLADAVVEQAVA